MQIAQMTTIVEKTADGTIYRAAKTYPIPDLDVLTLLFGEPIDVNEGPEYQGLTSLQILSTA